MKPNIVFFFTDQQRWDTIGVYGQPLEVTPNIDKMAGEGTLFEYGFTCQPVCGPARACLQTGLYASQTGNYRNSISLPTDRKLLAHYMKEAGYETGYIGKWHLASDRKTGTDYKETAVPPQLRGGYDDYWLAADALEHTSHGYNGYLFDAAMNRVDFKGYRADCITDFAINYINSRELNKPFYLMLSFLEPHHQNDHNQYEGPDGSKEKFKDFTVPGDLNGTAGDWKENYPDYLGCCASLDQNLGRLFRALDDKGILDNTIIIYSSDHGSHFRTRNKEYKRSGHENSIRVPFILWGKEFNSGRKINEMVSLIDIPPTILKAAGAGIPKDWQGRPVQDLLSGCNDWREEIFVQTTEAGITRVIRTKKWKYSICAVMDRETGLAAGNIFNEEFLFDLENDPFEKTNLIADRSFITVKNNLRDRLINKMVSIGEYRPQITIV
ncbi:MAG: sulfatase-like hydrolase/transferase [Treponema sp.]|nr:sulfatase-like hydrolase/transferase [Treponema sp.]